MTIQAGVNDEHVNGHVLEAAAEDIETFVTVAEAARLLGRDRTRVYALLRSGDLVAAPANEDSGGPVRIARASLERWLVAGGARGGPLTPRNAWALVGLAGQRLSALLRRAHGATRTPRRALAHTRAAGQRRKPGRAGRDCGGGRR